MAGRSKTIKSVILTIILLSMLIAGTSCGKKVGGIHDVIFRYESTIVAVEKDKHQITVSLDKEDDQDLVFGDETVVDLYLKETFDMDRVDIGYEIEFGIFLSDPPYKIDYIYGIQKKQVILTPKKMQGYVFADIINALLFDGRVVVVILHKKQNMGYNRQGENDKSGIYSAKAASRTLLSLPSKEI